MEETIKKWLSATVVGKEGTCIYVCRTADGRTKKLSKASNMALISEEEVREWGFEEDR